MSAIAYIKIKLAFASFSARILLPGITIHQTRDIAWIKNLLFDIFWLFPRILRICENLKVMEGNWWSDVLSSRQILYSEEEKSSSISSAHWTENSWNLSSWPWDPCFQWKKFRCLKMCLEKVWSRLYNHFGICDINALQCNEFAQLKLHLLFLLWE